MIAFRFDPAAWELAPARHAIGVLAPLIGHPYRLVSPGTPAPPGATEVFVGPPDHAPAGCRVVVPITEWPRWDPSSIQMASTPDGDIPCPNRDVGSPTTERCLAGAWLRSIGFLTQRDEEFGGRRDPWGCFSGAFSRMEELGALDLAIVNACARRLSDRLRSAAAAGGARLEAVERWKGGARFAVALSHDVDWVRRFDFAQSLRLIAQARSPRSHAFRHGLSSALDSLRHVNAPLDPFSSFDRIAEIESRAGFRSTFYVCPGRLGQRHEYDPLYRENDRLGFEGNLISVAEVMRLLAGRGFEIGLHGSYLSHQSSSELARQSGEIGRVLDHPVPGVRQHFLRFEASTTWAAQERAGFVYDSTLGYNEAIGFRAGIAAPFHPFDSERGASHRLLEVPLTLMDGVLFRTLRLGPRAAFERVLAHLDAVERTEGLAVLLWHPDAADPESHPGWWDTYAAVLEELTRRDAWVTTVGQIANWWLDREARASGLAASTLDQR